MSNIDLLNMCEMQLKIVFLSKKTSDYIKTKKKMELILITLEFPARATHLNANS